LWGREVAILGANILKLLRRRVKNLHIARDVLISINLREVVKGLIRNLSDIKFVIPNCQQIIVDVLENRIRHIAIRGGRVAQTSAVVQVLLQSALNHSTRRLSTYTRIDQ
jgi:hypothetical protein